MNKEFLLLFFSIVISTFLLSQSYSAAILFAQTESGSASGVTQNPTESILVCEFVEFCSNPVESNTNDNDTALITPITPLTEAQTTAETEAQTNPDSSEVFPDVTSNISEIMTPDLPGDLSAEDFQNPFGQGLQSTNVFDVLREEVQDDATLGEATLEEQLELAKEKISKAQQQGEYDSGTTNSQPNEWKTFEDLSAGISFVYPSDYYLYNTTVYTHLLIDLDKSFAIYYLSDSLLTSENMSLINEKIGSKIPTTGLFDTESINDFALSFIDATLRNNSNTLLIENITTDKWKVDSQNATSYMISIPGYSDSDYIRTEIILFTNPQKDHLYSATFSAPSSQFDTLEIKALEKRLIDSINITK